MDTPTPVPSCRFCAGTHASRGCPRVKALEYHADGTTVKCVEFFRHDELPDAFTFVVYPSDVIFEPAEG